MKKADRFSEGVTRTRNTTKQRNNETTKQRNNETTKQRNKYKMSNLNYKFLLKIPNSFKFIFQRRIQQEGKRQIWFADENQQPHDMI
jgi:hypothetical protein